MKEKGDPVATRIAQIAAASMYSARESLLSPGQIGPAAKAQGHTTAVLADQLLMPGFRAFAEGCREAGIQSTFGLSLCTKPEGQAPPGPGPGRRNEPWFLLFAKNQDGLKTLQRISEAAWSAHPEQRRDLLPQAGTDLLGIACNPEALKEAADLGYAAGAGFHPFLPETLKAAKAQNAPVLPLLPWYAAEDTEATRSALATLWANKSDGTHENAMDWMPKTVGPMPKETWLREIPPALQKNIQAFEEQCSITLPEPVFETLTFPGSSAEQDNQTLQEQAWAGLESRRPGAENVYQERMKEELRVIRNSGFAAVYLMAARIKAFCKEQGFPSGSGRGSAASSLVSWALRITEPDPIAHQLLFSRFLGEGRKSPPDFDIDVRPEDRGRIEQFIQQEWGENRVAGSAATWQLYKGRSAVRAACRVRRIPRGLEEKLARLCKKDEVPDNPNLAAAVQDPKDRPEARKALADARGIRGAISAISTHPGAILLTQPPIRDSFACATITVKDRSKFCTQEGAEAAEAQGAVKIDILSLQTIEQIERTREVARLFPDEAPVAELDPWNLPEDESVYEAIGLGNTTGVFQMEKEHFTRAMRELAPKRFEDIRAAIAIMRPATMAQFDSFVRRARGEEPADPPHPLMEEALRQTRGIIVYQEQAMQIAQDLGGFSAEDGYRFIKTISKKRADEARAMRPQFLDQAAKRLQSEALAREIWDLLEMHAGYSFNKAHATCYAAIGYATAYYRVKTPKAYMAAMADKALGKHSSALTRVALDAARIGVRIEKPCFLHSREKFSYVKDEDKVLVAPLQILPGIGSGPAQILARWEPGDRPRRKDDAMAQCEAKGIPKGKVELMNREQVFRRTT